MFFYGRLYFLYNLVTGCMSALHIIMLIIAILDYILILFILFLVSYFFADEGINSRVPWALCNFKVDLLRVIKLIFGAIALSSNLNKNYALISLIVFVIIDVIILYSHIFFLIYLYQIVQISDIIFTTITFLYSLYLLIVDVIYGYL